MGMRIRTWGYFIKESLASLVRNAWMTIASVGTVTVALLILGTFLLLAVNLDHMASTVESQVEITAYLEDGMQDAEIKDLSKKISAIGGIEQVKFVSKEEALTRLADRLGENKSLLEGYESDNPLRHSYEIRTKDADDVVRVAEAVAQTKGIAEVKYGREIVEKLLQFTKMVRVVGLVLMVGLAVAALFIIANTIRLTVYARRREIGIMKFVGATDWFIRWPFVVEGLFLGLLGSGLASLALVYLYRAVLRSVELNLPILPVVGATPLLSNLVKLMLTTGGLIGMIGSTISLRKFLKV